MCLDAVVDPPIGPYLRVLCVLCVLCVKGLVTDVSIIIVSFNARADLERCLESLHDSRPAARHEIVVVDNGSSDGSAAAARRWRDVRLIDAGSNVGFARANNIGIRATAGTNLLLLNSDTIVPPAAVDQLLAELEREPDVAVVGPRLVDAAGHAELSFGRMIGPLNELRQKRRARGGAVDALTSRRQYPDWVSGACLLVRRADAAAVGGLDERYFMYTEDVDFCAALRARGRRILFTPAVEVVHLRGRSASSVPAATRDAYRRSRIAFYEKHHPGWAPLLKVYLRLRRGMASSW
jgi:GT2 family glycosyltransferase